MATNFYRVSESGWRAVAADSGPIAGAMRRLARMMLIGLALALLASAAFGGTATRVEPLADGASTEPPPGFVGFCMREPDACTNRGADANVTLDDRTRALLSAVNDRVNRAIAYRSDPDHYGLANRWTLEVADGYGDCKDYALAKREALRAAGLPDSALRIAVVRTPKNELHAVLTVDTDQGVLVLDSLTSEIRPWSETPYAWVMRQGADSALHWVSLKAPQST